MRFVFDILQERRAAATNRLARDQSGPIQLAPADSASADRVARVNRAGRTSRLKVCTEHLPSKFGGPPTVRRHVRRVDRVGYTKSTLAGVL